MRIFEHPNVSGDWKCPICGTNNDGPIVLVGMDGTEDGNNMQAEQVHVDCVELRMQNKGSDKILYQWI